MSLSSDVVGQIFSLPLAERYELANRLLDSIDPHAAELDTQWKDELLKRRDEMINGEHLVSDWRAALQEISASLGVDEGK